MAQSTIEVEFIATIIAANQALWLKKLTDDLYVHQEDNEEIFVENQATLAISHNPVLHGRTKNFKVQYYFLRKVQRSR